MSKYSLCCVIFILSVFCKTSLALFIDGCPMFGCRPSGSFSMYLQIPRNNISLKWESSFDLDPVPGALGCVADTVNIVCPSNGPFAEDQGYISIFNENGTIRWRDIKLHYPTLPLLDNYGDVTGSDGIKLVHYDVNGKQYPTIPCEGLVPLFNLALIGNSYLLLVSQNGLIVVRETNGVPVGTLTLNDTIQDVKGVFIPVAQPVVNDQRFYVLTKFQPSVRRDKNVLPEAMRLYAVDVHSSITNRITIAWFVGIKSSKVSPKQSAPPVSASSSALIWNRYNQTVYVNVPGDQGRLLGVHDNGASAEIVFQTNIDIVNMAMFVSDHCALSKKQFSSHATEILPVLWTSTPDSKINQVSSEGYIIRTLDLEKIVKGSVTITSKLSVIRNSDTDTDILVLGLTRSFEVVKGEPNDQTASFVVALDTSNTGDEILLWMFPIPNNMILLGQIAGASGADVADKDQIIFYAETPGKNAKIFSIY